MLQVVSILAPYYHLAALKVSSFFGINFFLICFLLQFSCPLYFFIYIFFPLNWYDSVFFLYYWKPFTLLNRKLILWKLKDWIDSKHILNRKQFMGIYLLKNSNIFISTRKKGAWLFHPFTNVGIFWVNDIIFGKRENIKLNNIKNHC